MKAQGNSNKKFYSVNLTIEDKVIVAVSLSILSIVTSIFFNIFYKPAWVDEIVNTNKQLCSKVNKESLVLIGGGTIHEYFIKNEVFKKYYKIADSTSLIPVRVPSLSACKTLKDEMPNSSNGWIVLCSSKANRTDFMDENEIDEFKKKKRIIEVFLNRDTLLVITSKGFQFSKNPEDAYISTNDLKNILSQSDSNNFEIFTTSENSGTLKLYKDTLGQEFINSKNVRVFDLHTIYPEGKPYIILCSNIYKPKNYDYKNSSSYYVVNTNGKPIEKELYLYFNATFDNNTLKIPNSIEKFVQVVKEDFNTKNIELTDKLILKSYD